MKILLRVFAILCFTAFVPSSPCDAENGTVDEARKSLRRAVEFFRTEVATEGGYLWRYSEDLSKREGEGVASETRIWVQPPGTPSVGMAFLEAYQATGDEYCLDAAKEAASALVRGQLRSGGWAYSIEFDPEKRNDLQYRVDPERPDGHNVSTLDDDNTQSALRFLMEIDEALNFKDESIHEAATYGLSGVLNAQYPNGAWPQRFDSDSNDDPQKYPVKKASYPESWSREFPAVGYGAFYTFNDHTIPDTIRTMFMAHRIYGDERYFEAAKKAGDFILLAQMPEPQPAWAQQYDADMHPAWARKFEPPSITGLESQGVMRMLLTLYRQTGDRKYLEPIPRAIAYFRRSLLEDGRLARFYELHTNRPLYFTKDYKMTYEDDNLPTHYGFKVGNGIEAIAEEYERMRQMSPEELQALSREPSPELTPKLESQARKVIEALDERGRWAEEGRLPFHGSDDATRRIISCSTFARNVGVLSDYLLAVGHSEGSSVGQR